MRKIILLFLIACWSTLPVLAQCTNMTLSMSDSFGDGWNGAAYTISNTQTGVVVASGSLDFAAGGDGISTGTDFLCLSDGCYSIFVGGGSWDAEITWSLSNTATGTIAGSAPQTIDFEVGAGCGGGGGNPGGGCDNYTFSAFGGTFDTEISWNILNENGVIQSTGSSTNGIVLCLEPGCYTIEMFDSFGDGWNGANWQILDSGGSLIDQGTLLTGSVGTAIVAIGGASCGDGGNPGGGGPAIIVDGNSYLPAELISEVFLGDCLEASNITYTGSPEQIGTFSNGTGIGIEEGIILTTGDISLAPGPNSTGSDSHSAFSAGNALLTGLAGMPTNDAAVFTFDFTASTDAVSFTYVFASEEYPEFVCSSFNDVFGFFVSGPGYAPNTNIATVPGTNVPVAIDNVNNDPFCAPNYPAYYVDNTGGTAIEYDGYTVPLTATITTVPCETYQITIAVADAGDTAYDSAVFLQAQSFTAGVNVEVAASNLDGIQSTPASCGEGGVFTFVNDGEPFTEDVTLTFNIGGTAQAGAVYDPIPTQITFPAGTTILEIPIDGIVDQLPDSPQTVTLQLDQACTCSPPPEITLYLCAQLFLPVEWNGFIAEANAQQWQVECRWSTTDELNNDHFRIERSVDAVNWQSVGFEESVLSGEYAFTDRYPLAGEAYYRIVQVDYNGTESATGARRVLLQDDKETISVYPNPGNGTFRLQNWSGQELTVRNSNGQMIPFELSETGELHLAVAPGVYFIESVSPSGQIGRERLVVR